MSRYIKLDTAIEHTNQLYHGDEVEAWLESLPTIEVADLSEEAYEVGYTNGQMAERKRKIEVSEEELKGCDKVDKRFSEDAISREVAMDIVVSSTAEEMVEKMRNAPSVIPQQKEGEWISDARRRGWIYWTCSNCDYNAGKPTFKYCPNCGSKMKGADDD